MAPYTPQLKAGIAQSVELVAELALRSEGLATNLMRDENSGVALHIIYTT